jgi:hypothetical protein
LVWRSRIENNHFGNWWRRYFSGWFTKLGSWLKLDLTQLDRHFCGWRKDHS